MKGDIRIVVELDVPDTLPRTTVMMLAQAMQEAGIRESRLVGVGVVATRIELQVVK